MERGVKLRGAAGSTEHLDPLAGIAGAAAAGDPAAVRELVKALSPRVLSVARRILGASHADVDDMVQESLLAILRAMPAFQGNSSVVHYATRIAARTCIAQQRKTRSRSQRRDEFEVQRANVLSPNPMTPADHTLSQRRREEVLRLINALPEEQAESLLLRTVLGHSLQEVSEITGAPINTVRSRVRLAKVALRRRIQTIAPEL